jgi:glutamate/tyrosine decarboxylase-like PLP-dependent enzyme
MNHKQSEKEVLAEVFELINRWISESQSKDIPVIDYHAPKELSSKLSLKIEEEGTGPVGLLDDIHTYLKFAVKTAHPGYLNQLFGGFNFPAFVGEVITALTNTSMYTYEVSPVATLMEIELMNKMISFTGWNSGTGSLLTGGSNTNMVAMLLARNKIFKGAKQEGISGLPKLAILVSERSHFSMLKGANTIGIGQGGVIKVKTDALGRMRGPELEDALEGALKAGFMPFMVCSTVGTTETGAFDNVDEISDVASKHELWHHVDGSWGGSIILSESRRNMFKGLEKADSFSWNPHKMMNIPLVCSALLVKDPNIMREEIQSHDADYIYHENESSSYDLGPASLQCGRRVDSLKLWLAWKYFGDKGYEKRIEKLFELAEFSTSLIEADPDLELMFPTQTLNVNFRYKVPHGIDADHFNESLRYQLINDGKAMVNYCRLDNGLSIRLILLNPDLETEDLERFFTHFKETARALLPQYLATANI